MRKTKNEYRVEVVVAKEAEPNITSCYRFSVGKDVDLETARVYIGKQLGVAGLQVWDSAMAEWETVEGKESE